MARTTRSTGEPQPAPAASGSGPKPVRKIAGRRRKVPNGRNNKKRRIELSEDESDSDEDDTDSLFAGLAADAQDLGEQMDSDNEEIEKPTLANYKTYLGRLSIQRVRGRLALRARTHTRPSNAALAELQMIEKRYHDSIALVAWAANLSEATAEKYAGMSPTTRAASGYNNFAGYSKAALGLDMPFTGDGSGITSRNKAMKALYAALDEDEKTIFRKRYFDALVGVPSFDTQDPADVDAVQVLEAQVTKLTPEEESLYRPIYDRLVCKDRVLARFGANARLPSTPAQVSLALKEFNNIHRQIASYASRHNVAFYLVAAHTAPGIGWTREATNRLKYAEWLGLKYQVAMIFGLYAQGQSIVKALEQAKPGITKRVRKPRADSDRVKLDLGNALNNLLEVALGRKVPHGFPKGPDPLEVIAKKGFPLEVVFGPTARLDDSDIKVGFRRMKKVQREDWLADIRDGRFLLVRTDGEGVEEVAGVENEGEVQDE